MIDEYRPGFGGTTAVTLEKRVQTWLQIVPVVLGVLRVKYVALMSHSAGTIYAFNTAAKLPHLLYPGGKAFMGCLGEFCLSIVIFPFFRYAFPLAYLLPSSFLCSFSYIVLFSYLRTSRKEMVALTHTTAPWVHPTYSSAPLSQVIDKLPASWVGNLHHIQSFIGNYITPSLAFSSARLGVQPSLTEEQSQNAYGMEAKTWDEVGRLQQKWRGMEDMRLVLSYSQLTLMHISRERYCE